MNLLFDESLSPKPIPSLPDLFPWLGKCASAIAEYWPTPRPTTIAAEVIRRNAIRIAELLNSPERLIVLDQ